MGRLCRRSGTHQAEDHNQGYRTHSAEAGRTLPEDGWHQRIQAVLRLAADRMHLASLAAACGLEVANNLAAAGCLVQYLAAAHLVRRPLDDNCIRKHHTQTTP